MKQKEHDGYHYEAADASFALLIRRTTGEDEPLFELESFRIISEKQADTETTVEATIKLFVSACFSEMMRKLSSSKSGSSSPVVRLMSRAKEASAAS